MPGRCRSANAHALTLTEDHWALLQVRIARRGGDGERHLAPRNPGNPVNYNVNWTYGGDGSRNGALAGRLLRSFMFSCA